MRRGRTLSELAWPKTSEFTRVARRWRKDAPNVLMGYVWDAYDDLRNDVLTQVDATRATDDVERDVTEHLHRRLERRLNAGGAFNHVAVRHAPCERESRRKPPAQPPTYDMAFELIAMPRVMWPLEAKVLKTPSSATDYVRTFRSRFMTCVYAPFSSQGSMVAYLFSGHEDDAFDAIAAGIPCTLQDGTDHPGRAHKLSRHTRAVPPGKSYPARFTCHHLVLHMAPALRPAAAGGVGAPAMGRPRRSRRARTRKRSK